MAWTFKDVDLVAGRIIRNIPTAAMEMLTSDGFVGVSSLVRLSGPLSRPSFKELRSNFVWLKPLAQSFPDRAPALHCRPCKDRSDNMQFCHFVLSQVPSGMLLTDILIRTHVRLDHRLLDSGRDVAVLRVQAATEAGKLKRCMSSLRYLFRNSGSAVYMHLGKPFACQNFSVRLLMPSTLRRALPLPARHRAQGLPDEDTAGRVAQPTNGQVMVFEMELFRSMLNHVMLWKTRRPRTSWKRLLPEACYSGAR